jgi:hypothetical protein
MFTDSVNCSNEFQLLNGYTIVMGARSESKSKCNKRMTALKGCLTIQTLATTHHPDDPWYNQVAVPESDFVSKETIAELVEMILLQSTSGFGLAMH